MTGINSPFSQFNTSYLPAYNRVNTSMQNNALLKEDVAQQPNKKQFTSKDLLIPVIATAAGSIGGFAVAQFNKHKKNNSVKIQIEEYKTTLLQEFNKNSDVNTINDNLQRVNAVLKTIKENGIDYIEKVLANEKSPKRIASLKESLKKSKAAKEYQEAALKKLSMDLKTKFTDLVEKPLKEFTDNLVNKTVQHNKVFTKKTVIVSTLVGLTIGTIIFCIKNRQKEEKNESRNTIF